MRRIVLKRCQAGIGLVEIMVALVIGLFLVGGLTQVFLSNKQGFRIQEAQSRLQENVRLVSVLLGSGIGKAEFLQNAQDDPTNVFGGVNPAICGTNDGGNLAACPAQPAGTRTNTDTITFSFQADGVLTNCLGGTVAAGAISTNTYRVDNGRTLQCITATTIAGVTAASNTQPLLDNIDDMQILYGEDTNANGSVDRYVNATTATLDFNDVLSVHVALLLASDGDVKPAADSRVYNLLGTNVTMPATDTDRRQRRIVERVIALRNRLR